MSDFRRYFLPYCLERQKDGRYLVPTLLLLIATTPSWGQDLRIQQDESGSKTITNLPAECFDGGDHDSRVTGVCTLSDPPIRPTHQVTEPEKPSELELTERALKKATAERDRIRRQYEGLREQMRINPRDEGARHTIPIYSTRLREKEQEVFNLRQRLFFLRFGESMK